MARRTDPSYVVRAQGRTWPLWFKLTIILGLGIAVGCADVVVVDHLYRQSLLARASGVASALDATEVASLKDRSDPLYDQRYTDVKQKLAAVKQSLGSTRFVYLMARDDSRGVYFLADSEPVGSSGYSPNGETFPEASQRLQASFVTGARFVEGPIGDRWGRWLSALAPVRAAGASKPVAVLGTDVPASTYLAYLSLAGGIPLLLALLAATVVYMTENLRRRRQEALRFRSELVSIASHELRSPLAGLRWSQELMMSYQLDDKVQKSLELMHNSTLKLQESIEDVLQLANLQSGKRQKLDIAEVNIVALIADVFAIQQPAATEHRVTLGYGHDWPVRLLLSADKRKLKRVFNNLVSNAIKYGKPDTPVTVGYQQTALRHLITVSDHGIGIPKAEQDKVFSGFYRAANARKASINGTGMGLFLSRAIVEQHGGELWLDSSEQAGTTVFVALPRQESATPPAA